MDKELFKSYLLAASQKAVECSIPRINNTLSLNIKYRIQPDSIEERSDLNEWEEQLRKKRIILMPKILRVDEAVDALWFQGCVPTFVNISIFKSEKKATIIKLYIDSRYKCNVDELYHKSEGYPPFHAVLEIPIYMDENDRSKFDINWQHQKWRLKFKMWKRQIELKKKYKL